VQNSDFHINISVPKINQPSIFFFFSSKNNILEAELIFKSFDNSMIFELLYFLKICPVLSDNFSKKHEKIYF
jgi:hypothetical protein